MKHSWYPTFDSRYVVFEIDDLTDWLDQLNLVIDGAYDESCGENAFLTGLSLEDAMHRLKKPPVPLCYLEDDPRYADV